ncbi:MAG: hypothetical protein GWN21_15905 [Gammaproteobacteria bacterium]|nr:hypothetical protein [Gammaproteobacteria bacterium]NIR24657.1 hypothetical protein [Gammaproteobacteria bacterium]NIS06271.1 hypothetical protein [Gammaproteobacteria bacterium]NIU42097.1 hypothetical protein [Gammaproteobacteria bacterium]NIV49027.1 hypothetical protein [Gammaproteobacteria bacterium]
MPRRLSCGILGLALLAAAGAASAECEGMRVIVRNAVYPIHGLDAFCKEFREMKAVLADMRSALSEARQENRMLRARLSARDAAIERERLAASGGAERAHGGPSAGGESLR